MEAVWFWIVALMIVGYVLLDGYDLGAGIVHLLVARTDVERRQVLASIRPLWDGNEVWLLAGGGTLYFAFPKLYASGFSGLYLALMVVLWLLMLRGISIEFRSLVKSAVWAPFWDVVFGLSSILLSIFLGAAIGNVIRGVPLDSDGRFFLALWTNFMPGAAPGILDWYTVLVALAAFNALLLYGALWVSMRTQGEIEQKSLKLASRSWWPLLVLVVIISFASFSVQPLLKTSFQARPWTVVFPVAGLAALFSVKWLVRLGLAARAFLMMAVFIALLLASAALGVFPTLLPATTDPAFSLTIQNAAAAPYGLRVGMVWFIPGMLLAITYSVFAHTRFSGKVNLESQEH